MSKIGHVVVAFTLILVGCGGGAGAPDTSAPLTTWAPVTTPPTVTTPPPTSSTTVVTGLSALEGTFRGKIFRDDEPGTPETWHLASLDIRLMDGDVIGELIHAPVTANSLDAFGNVTMPVDLQLDGSTLRVRWDPTVGEYSDTAFAQCRWDLVELTLDVGDEGRILSYIDGHMTALPPESSEVTEWWAGCPNGRRSINRATLVRQ